MWFQQTGAFTLCSVESGMHFILHDQTAIHLKCIYTWYFYNQIAMQLEESEVTKCK